MIYQRLRSKASFAGWRNPESDNSLESRFVDSSDSCRLPQFFLTLIIGNVINTIYYINQYNVLYINTINKISVIIFVGIKTLIHACIFICLYLYVLKNLFNINMYWMIESPNPILWDWPNSRIPVWWARILEPVSLLLRSKGTLEIIWKFKSLWFLSI